MEYGFANHTKLELQPKNFAFRPGQYAFLNIPAISMFQWHPFTISSAPGTSSVTFHVKDMGRGAFRLRPFLLFRNLDTRARNCLWNSMGPENSTESGWSLRKCSRSF
jgi:NAD(P)H-flavin reductase